MILLKIHKLDEMNHLPTISGKFKKHKTLGTADFRFKCTKCQHVQLIASGYIGAAYLDSEDLRYAAADKMNWQHNPDICPKCLGLKSITSGYDLLDEKSSKGHSRKWIE
jgi:hypothetical protein